MITPNTPVYPILALQHFFDIWGGDLLPNIGPRLHCSECEALCDLFESFGYKEQAKTLREWHSLDDDEGDLAQHLAIKAELNKGTV